jgi:ribonuclease HI
MKSTFHIAFWSLSFVLLSAAAFAQGGQGTESSGPLVQALMEKSDEVYSLRKSKDVNGIKALLADDFDYVGGDGRLHHRDELLGDMQDGTLRDFKLYEPHAVQIDSGTALLTYSAIIDMREGDEPGMAPRYQKVSDLWVRQGHEWRLKFEQATPLRPID